MRILARRSAYRPDDARLLLVELGRVACPRTGDADIETCYVCGWMTDAHLGGVQPSVRCVARRSAALADRAAFMR